MTKHILSCGMGQNSVSLAIWLINNKKPLDLIVFCDTGAEMPETYNILPEFKKYCKDKGIEFQTITGKYGNIIKYYEEKKLIPTRLFRHCTHKFKVIPFNKYVQKRYGKEEQLNVYIGIGSDEEKRRNGFENKETKQIKYLFPFLDDERIGRKESVKIIQDERMSIPVKSGCFMCPFQTKKSWIKLYQEHNDKFEESIAFEKNCKEYPRITLIGESKLEDLKLALQEQRSLNSFFEKKEGVEIEQCAYCIL